MPSPITLAGASQKRLRLGFKSGVVIGLITGAFLMLSVLAVASLLDPSEPQMHVVNTNSRTY